jgi:hypothetical protein
MVDIHNSIEGGKSNSFVSYFYAFVLSEQLLLTSLKSSNKITNKDNLVWVKITRALTSSKRRSKAIAHLREYMDPSSCSRWLASKSTRHTLPQMAESLSLIY